MPGVEIILHGRPHGSSVGVREDCSVAPGLDPNLYFKIRVLEEIRDVVPEYPAGGWCVDRDVAGLFVLVALRGPAGTFLNSTDSSCPETPSVWGMLSPKTSEKVINLGRLTRTSDGQRFDYEPGEYELEIHASGRKLGMDGVDRVFDVRASAAIRVTR